MDDYDIRSAASILASVKEQEARFERLTRALEEERRNVSLQLERAHQPADRMSICNIGNGQPLATAWQQLVLQLANPSDTQGLSGGFCVKGIKALLAPGPGIEWGLAGWVCDEVNKETTRGLYQCYAKMRAPDLTEMKFPG
ncbi:hypothetical protein WISP_99324 [Willisornis vidua]|uniref:Uncharacterized protein n=1 Tax=Willisornis vidua TaxID=1566151 RepID=A0ABQ9D544_9PASS|nr:hypothetical protein WISP_99324 [Willisornis vidua]